jgi:pimeloyl-ACP methyl ester carboxylesterase
MHMLVRTIAVAVLLLSAAHGQDIDSTSHTVQFIAVDNNVKLEVLDWGGSGRSLVLLAGLGNTAHVFDKFAPKLTGAYHVYGITRRGFGASSAPSPSADNYRADRLGDDVLAVLDALRLNRPVLIGHSGAGAEMSSIGSRYPQRVARLVYLDAGYAYAYYDRSAWVAGIWEMDSYQLQQKLQQLQFGKGPPDARPLVQEMLKTILPQIEEDLRHLQNDVEETPGRFAAPPTTSPFNPAMLAVMEGGQKYTNIPVPVLAIFALSGSLLHQSDVEGQATAFEKGVPSARVVRLPHAEHYVYRSNEADVLREINVFVRSLP